MLYVKISIKIQEPLKISLNHTEFILAKGPVQTFKTDCQNEKNQTMFFKAFVVCLKNNL